MRYLRIRQVECGVSGMNGWAVKGIPMDDDIAASMSHNMTLVAHDIVEHPSLATIGTVEDELEALGGAWNVRGKWGDGVTDEGLSGDVANMFGASGGEIQKAPKLRGYHAEDAFKDIIKNAKNGARHEHGFTAQKWKKFKKQALRWMMSGFAKSVRKFGDRFVGNNLFNKIKDALEDAARFADYGDEIILGYAYKGNHVRVTARISNRDWGDY